MVDPVIVLPSFHFNSRENNKNRATIYNELYHLTNRESKDVGSGQSLDPPYSNNVMKPSAFGLDEMTHICVFVQCLCKFPWYHTPRSGNKALPAFCRLYSSMNIKVYEFQQPLTFVGVVHGDIHREAIPSALVEVGIWKLKFLH